MDTQQIFNYVIPALIAQGGQSVDGGGACVYRGVDGRKCAIGMLIKDEFYKPELEGTSVAYPDVIAALHRSGVNTQSNGEFLHNLQCIHDKFSLTAGIPWKEHVVRSAAAVAEYHNLHMPTGLVLS